MSLRVNSTQLNFKHKILFSFNGNKISVYIYNFLAALSKAKILPCFQLVHGLGIRHKFFLRVSWSGVEPVRWNTTDLKGGRNAITTDSSCTFSDTDNVAPTKCQNLLWTRPRQRNTEEQGHLEDGLKFRLSAWLHFTGTSTTLQKCEIFPGPAEILCL